MKHRKHRSEELGWLLALGLFMLAANLHAAKPNIIFIMADDLGWQDVGYMGADFFETPNIDRLANQGMRFTAAYSGGPNCAPTRACLMTGTYTPRHHIYTPGGKAKGNSKYMRLLVPVKDRKNKELERRPRLSFRLVTRLILISSAFQKCSARLAIARRGLASGILATTRKALT